MAISENECREVARKEIELLTSIDKNLKEITKILNNKSKLIDDIHAIRVAICGDEAKI